MAYSGRQRLLSLVAEFEWETPIGDEVVKQLVLPHKKLSHNSMTPSVVQQEDLGENPREILLAPVPERCEAVDSKL